MSKKIIAGVVGDVTAYAYAKAGGYTGTEEEFQALMAANVEAAKYADEVRAAAAAANEDKEAAAESKDAAAASASAAAASQADAATSKAAAETAANYARTYTGAPRVAATAAAMTDQSLIYVYTGSETGYTAGNWYFWDGTTWTSGGVYNSTALETDETLTVSGAAADAKVTGDEIGALNNALRANIVNEQLFGASDALLYGNRNTVLINGVTFTFNQDGSCTVSGTADGTAFADYYINANALPDWIRPNVQYHLTYSSTNVNFRVTIATNGTWAETNLLNHKQDANFIVPSTATGLLIRLVVSSGRTANETVDPHIYIGTPNDVLKTLIDRSLKTEYGAYTGSSVNNIDDNSIRICDGSSVSDLPSNNVFVVETVYTTENKSAGQQNAYAFTNGQRWWRKKTSNLWGTWKDIDKKNDIVVYYGALPSGSNANDISTTSRYLISTGYDYANLPSGFDSGHLITFYFSPNLSAQFAIKFDTGAAYYRIKSGAQGTWKKWISYEDPHNLAIGTKYVAFGDSLTWGAVWDMEQSTPYYRAAPKYQIPTRIANAIGMIENYDNKGIGGAGYYAAPTGGLSVTDAILAYDFTDVEIVTIMSGVNDKADSTHPLGTSSNPASGTICGAVKQIIDFLADNYPKTQIVFIQPTPSGHLSDPWNGKLAGGWSMNDFDNEVGTLCHNEHVGYINWWESVFCKQWDTFSGGYSKNPTSGNVSGPNYSHPTNEQDYAMIGDFIAGKVATLFHGHN